MQNTKKIVNVEVMVVHMEATARFRIEIASFPKVVILVK